MGFGLCNNFKVCTFCSPWWTKGELFHHHTVCEAWEAIEVFPLAAASFLAVNQMRGPNEGSIPGGGLTNGAHPSGDGPGMDIKVGGTGRVHQSGANMKLFCWGQHNML